MVKMFWMIVGAISVPLVYGFLRTEKFYDGVSIVAPGDEARSMKAKAAARKRDQ
jgi:hypothetical protein